MKPWAVYEGSYSTIQSYCRLVPLIQLTEILPEAHSNNYVKDDIPERHGNREMTFTTILIYDNPSLGLS